MFNETSEVHKVLGTVKKTIQTMMKRNTWAAVFSLWAIGNNSMSFSQAEI